MSDPKRRTLWQIAAAQLLLVAVPLYGSLPDLSAPTATSAHACLSHEQLRALLAREAAAPTSVPEDPEALPHDARARAAARPLTLVARCSIALQRHASATALALALDEPKLHVWAIAICRAKQLQAAQQFEIEIAVACDVARYFHADGLGSIRALTDEQGNVTDRYDFEAFGTLISHQGEDSQAYLFAGEALDSNAGWYYNRARWMLPGVGRFASIDPLGSGIRRNAMLGLYAYAEDSPASYADPSGQQSLGIALAAVAVLGVIAYIGIEVYRHVIWPRSLPITYHVIQDGPPIQAACCLGHPYRALIRAQNAEDLVVVQWVKGSARTPVGVVSDTLGAWVPDTGGPTPGVPESWERASYPNQLRKPGMIYMRDNPGFGDPIFVTDQTGRTVDMSQPLGRGWYRIDYDFRVNVYHYKSVRKKDPLVADFISPTYPRPLLSRTWSAHDEWHVP